MSEILRTVSALSAALESGSHKVASKSPVLAILAKMRSTLMSIEAQGGRVFFDMDI